MTPRTRVRNTALSERMASQWTDTTKGKDGLTFRERRSLQSKLQRAVELGREDFPWADGRITVVDARALLAKRDPFVEGGTAGARVDAPPTAQAGPQGSGPNRPADPPADPLPAPGGSSDPPKARRWGMGRW